MKRKIYVLVVTRVCVNADEAESDSQAVARVWHNWSGSDLDEFRGITQSAKLDPNQEEEEN